MKYYILYYSYKLGKYRFYGDEVIRTDKRVRGSQIEGLLPEHHEKERVIGLHEISEAEAFELKPSFLPKEKAVDRSFNELKRSITYNTENIEL